MSRRLYFALGIPVAWPARCFRCAAPDPRTTVKLDTEQVVGMPGLIVHSNRVDIEVPVCSHCEGAHRRNKSLLWFFLLVSVFGLIALGLTAALHWKLHPAVAISSFAASFALVIWLKLYFAHWYDKRSLGLRGAAIYDHNTFWIEPTTDKLYKELDHLNSAR